MDGILILANSPIVASTYRSTPLVRFVYDERFPLKNQQRQRGFFERVIDCFGRDPRRFQLLLLGQCSSTGVPQNM